jgi:hypothetical protein
LTSPRPCRIHHLAAAHNQHINTFGVRPHADRPFETWRAGLAILVKTRGLQGLDDSCSPPGADLIWIPKSASYGCYRASAWTCIKVKSDNKENHLINSIQPFPPFVWTS